MFRQTFRNATRQLTQLLCRKDMGRKRRKKGQWASIEGLEQRQLLTSIVSFRPGIVQSTNAPVATTSQTLVQGPLNAGSVITGAGSTGSGNTVSDGIVAIVNEDVAAVRAETQPVAAPVPFSPRLEVSDARIIEPLQGVRMAVFDVRLASYRHNETYEFNYATQADTAMKGLNYWRSSGKVRKVSMNVGGFLLNHSGNCDAILACSRYSDPCATRV